MDPEDTANLEVKSEKADHSVKSGAKKTQGYSIGNLVGLLRFQVGENSERG